MYNKENYETREVRINNLGNLISLDWTIDSNPRTKVKIYTDGSKKEDRTGAGVVILKEAGGKVIIKERIDGESSYEAELSALQITIERMREENIKEFDVYTDSKSALESLRSIKFKGKIVEEIKEIIIKENMKVHLHWVKALVEIAGNEEADETAKAATKLSEIGVRYKQTKKVR